MAISNPFLWGSAGRKMTPEQVARERERASAMLEGVGDVSPVGHWTQGLGRVVNAITGKIQDRRADASEQLGLDSADEYVASNPVLASLIGGSPVTTFGGSDMPPLNRSGGGGGSVGFSGAGADGIREGLVQRGLPPHVADAFVLNFQDESGLDPSINEHSPLVPGSRGGFGLSQWTGPRRVALERFAADRGAPVDDVDTQLDFLVSELQGPERDAAQAILSSPDTPTAAAAIVNRFLRPAEEHRARREAAYLGGGGASPALSAAQGQQAGVVEALAGAMSNPWVAQKYGPVIQAVMDQQMRRGDMAYQSQLRQSDPMYQAQLAQLTTPKAPEPITVGGVLVDPVTYQPLFDSRTDKDPTSVGEYKFYADQATAAGQEPMPYDQWDVARRQAGATGLSVTTGEGEKDRYLYGSDAGLPQGWRLDRETGQASQTPGGPAALEAEQLGRKAEGAQAQKARAGETVVQDLQRALDLIPELGILSSGGGVVGGISRTTQAKVPGSVVNRITQFTESALSNVGLDTLQTMRENSPTGGALGQVPIQQQQRLEQVLGSLNVDQPPEVLEANIKRVINIYTDIIYGDARERQRAVAEGKMTPEQSAEIDSYYYELPFDERGRPVSQSDGGGIPDFRSMSDAELDEYIARGGG